MASPSATPSGPLAIPALAIRQLDLTPLADLARWSLPELLEHSDSLALALEWPRQPEDPRELSEIAEVRLWSLRADALLPWLPLVLERSSGQLTRHVAMLLPHGFSRTEGIRFAAESLELWITHRLFLLDHLARLEGLSCRGSLSQMAAVLGFELDAGFWEALPPP
ncbi:MAG: CRR6 family NdhI maturation factor [Synechococcaceae cyanobacterium ELA263]